MSMLYKYLFRNEFGTRIDKLVPEEDPIWNLKDRSRFFYQKNSLVVMYIKNDDNGFCFDIMAFAFDTIGDSYSEESVSRKSKE